MLHIPTHNLEHHGESEIEPSTTPGGTPIPFHVKRFGSTSHIAPPILVVEATSHIPPRSRVSDPIRIIDPRRVTIGNSTTLLLRSLRPLSLLLQMFTLHLIHVVLWAEILLRVMSVL